MPGVITVGDRSVPFHGDIKVINEDFVLVDGQDLFDLGFTAENIKKYGTILIAAGQPTKIVLTRQICNFTNTLKQWQTRQLALSLLSSHTGAEGEFNEKYLDSLVAYGVLETSEGRYRTRPVDGPKTN